MSPVEQMYEDFQPVLQSCRPADALHALQNLVRSFPDFARAHNDLGTLYYRQGEQNKALGHFERAVKISPATAAFQKNVADFYYVEMGRAEDAVRIYADILQIRPQDVETRMTAAHILASLKRFDEAGAYYRKVLEIEPWNIEAGENLRKISTLAAGGNGGRKAEDMYAEAQRLAEQGDPAGARRQLEKILEIHPDFGPAHNDLGVLCYQSGEKQKSLDHYEEAVRIQPESHTYQKNLADFYYIEQGRVEDALRLYVRVLESRPEDVESLMATGHISVSLSLWDDARTFFGRVLEIEPWHAQAREWLNALDRHTPDSVTASSTPSAQDTYAEAARLVAAGGVQAGRECLERLLGSHPDFALAHNDLGVLAYQAGEKQKALECYQKAVELEPGNLTFRKNLADCYWVGFGRIEDALKIYVDVLTSHPEDIETLLATGKLSLELRQADDARIFFDRVLEIEPWNAEAHEQIKRLELAARAA